MGVRVETMAYVSSVDSVGPMAMDVAWKEGAKGLPVTAVMPGYHGTKAEVRATVERLAGKGLCAVGINLRGRGGAPGEIDSGAAEIHDIADALGTVCRELKTTVDADRWSIVGYSGGGGNVLSAVTKFPGRFGVAVSFFGISDYAIWHATTSRKDCVESMHRWIGGSPEVYPDRYRARSSLLAAGNAQWTDVHLFWDEEETECPEPMHSNFKSAAQEQSCGRAKVTLHCSRKTDTHRWFHGYPDGIPSLIAAEDLFVPLILKSQGPIKLPAEGELAVPGFVAAEAWEYWLEAGQSGFERVRYTTDSSGRVKIFRKNPDSLLENPSANS